MNDSSKGILLATLAGILWGTVSPVTKYLASLHTDMLTVILIRVLVVLAVMGFYFMLFDRKGLRIGARKALLIFLYSALGIAGVYMGFLISLVYLSVGVAIVVHYTFPLFTTLGAALLTRKAPSAWDFGSALLIVVGVTVSMVLPAGGTGSAISLAGILWGFLAAFGMAAQSLMGRHVARSGSVSPSVFLFYSHLFGLFWLAMAKTLSSGWGDFASLSVSQWGWSAYMGLVASLFAFLAYYVGMKYIPAATASLLATIEIVAAVGLTTIALGQIPSAAEISGCCIIMTAIYLASLGARETKHTGHIPPRQRKKARAWS